MPFALDADLGSAVVVTPAGSSHTLVTTADAVADLIEITISTPGTTVTGVTDTAGNAYQRARAHTNGNGHVDKWWTFGDLPSGSTITVTTAATPLNSHIGANGYSGFTNPQIHVVNSASQFNATAWASGAITTTKANALLTGASAMFGAASTSTPGAGWTERDDLTATGEGSMTSVDQVVSATGSYTASGTWVAASGTDQASVIVSYFDQAPAPDTTQTRPELSVGVSVASAAAAWTAGAYVAAIASYPYPIALDQLELKNPAAPALTTTYEALIEIATGAAGAETVIAQVPWTFRNVTAVGYLMGDPIDVALPEPIEIPAGTRLAVRVSDSHTAALTYTGVKAMFRELAVAGGGPTGTATTSGGGSSVATGRKGAVRAVTSTGGGTSLAARIKAALRSVFSSGGGAATVTATRSARGIAATTGGGGQAVVVRKGGARPAVTVGGGTSTASGRRGGVTAATVTGGGTSVASGRKGGRAAAAISTGGTSTATGRKAVSRPATATGGGSSSAAGSAGTVPNHNGTAFSRGGGSSTAGGRKGALRAVAGTGGGGCTAQGRKAAARSAATTGSGTAITTGRKAGRGACAGTGGGSATPAWRRGARGACNVTGGGSSVATGFNGVVVVPVMYAPIAPGHVTPPHAGAALGTVAGSPVRLGSGRPTTVKTGRAR